MMHLSQIKVHTTFFVFAPFASLPAPACTHLFSFYVFDSLVLLLFVASALVASGVWTPLL